MASKKFKVGDIVIGNDRASDAYSITIKGFKGRVISVGESNGIVITRLEDSDFSSNEFIVSSDCFEILKKQVSVSKKGLKAIYPHVCEGWQAKIKEVLVVSVLDDSDTAYVNPEDLESAYAQANIEQREKLEKYLKISKFLSKKESINDLKIGQIFQVDLEESSFAGLHIMRTYDEHVCLELPNNSWAIDTPLSYKGKILKNGTKVIISEQ